MGRVGLAVNALFLALLATTGLLHSTAASRAIKGEILPPPSSSLPTVSHPSFDQYKDSKWQVPCGVDPIHNQVHHTSSPPITVSARNFDRKLWQDPICTPTTSPFSPPNPGH
ncbi:hypothetical protein Sjap_023752 [Stephania japonica]|uniref:Uncharacterized protein n=1 Tax=Stephania japonica TaxID=461633 RepID=A0AAP0EEA5_9MAGN